MILRRDDFTRNVAKLAGFTIKDTKDFIRAFEQALKDAAADGDEVWLSGTMRMEIFHAAESRRKHPATGEYTVKPAHYIVKLRALSDLKRQVNQQQG